MTPPTCTERIDAIRRFNRLYTRQIGVLRPRLLDSPFSLAEARVLFEIASQPTADAASIGRELDLDRGYLSRLIGDFERRGFVIRTAAPDDGRRRLLVLSEAGRRVFLDLEARSRREIATWLAELPDAAQRKLQQAMESIEAVLAPTAPHPPACRLRAHRPGDMGWVVQRHAALYAEEYGWNSDFEALVAEIAARFLRRFNADHDGCWIAERAGTPVGSVIVVRKSARVAQLRLLIVEPSARGLGIGRQLVEEAIGFARAAGYRSMVLWTNANLHAARRLYQAAGFRLIDESPHHSFGHDLIGQRWQLAL